MSETWTNKVPEFAKIQKESSLGMETRRLDALHKELSFAEQRLDSVLTNLDQIGIRAFGPSPIAEASPPERFQGGGIVDEIDATVARVHRQLLAMEDLLRRLMML